MASGYAKLQGHKKVFKLQKVSTSATRVKFPEKQFRLVGGGGGGGEVGLEKFGLYTWKQQDLEVVILYKKFEWHPDSLIAVIYEKISLKFHVPVDMPNHPPGTGAQKWEVKDSFEATIRVKQSLMAIILKHLYLTNRDTDL